MKIENLVTSSNKHNKLKNINSAILVYLLILKYKFCLRCINLCPGHAASLLDSNINTIQITILILTNYNIKRYYND